MNNNPRLGMLAMLASTFGFAVMNILVAVTSAKFSLFEQCFFANIVSFGFSYCQVKKNKVCKFGAKKNHKIFWMRAIFGTLATLTSYYATANTNQSDFAIISKLTPIIIVFIAFIFLGERINKWQIIALCVAMLGVMAVSQPQFNSSQLPILVSIAAAILSGFAHSCVAALRGKEHPATILLSFSTFGTIFHGICMLPFFTMPSCMEFVQLISIGITSCFALHFLTLSYTQADASVVSIYSYTGIIMSMGLGYCFLQQTVTWSSVLGGILVTASSILVYYGSKQQKAKSAAQSH